MRGAQRRVLRDDMDCLWLGCDHNRNVIMEMRTTLLIVGLLIVELFLIIGGVQLFNWVMQ